MSIWDEYAVTILGGNNSYPLPFDDIPQAGQEKSLLEKLEEKQPMSYMRLDVAGISARAVRGIFNQGHSGLSEWERWKLAVEEVTNRSWEEIAPIIYEGYL